MPVFRNSRGREPRFPFRRGARIEPRVFLYMEKTMKTKKWTFGIREDVL